MTHLHVGPDQFWISLLNSPQFSFTRNTFGRLFQIRAPSWAKEFRPYLVVLARDITAGLSFRREYFDCFSAIRFSIKVGAMLLTILNTSRAIYFTLLIDTQTYALNRLHSLSRYLSYKQIYNAATDIVFSECCITDVTSW